MKIFISYSHKDKAFVLQLYQSLRSASLDVFLAEKDIGFGEDIVTKIEQALDAASTILYVISKDSTISRWVREELSIAKTKAASEAGMKIVPILIDDVDIPIGVRHLKYADFRLWQNLEAYLYRISDLFVAFGVKTTLPHEEAIYFALLNYELIHNLARTLFASYYQMDSIVTGYDNCTISSDDYISVKQAYTNFLQLGLPELIQEVIERLDGKYDNELREIKEGLIKLNSAIGEISHYHDKSIGWLFNQKRAFWSVAARLEKLEYSASLHALTLVRPPKK